MNKQILWIHGWGVSSRVWKEVSMKFPEYEHQFVSFSKCNHVEDFYSVIQDKLAANKGPWIIVGWSMGAMLALETFFENEQSKRHHIEALVLVAATLRFIHSDRAKGWPQRVVDRMMKQLPLQRELTLNHFKELMLSTSEKENGIMEDLLQLTDVDYTIEGLQAGLTYLVETDLRMQWDQYAEQLKYPRLLWIHGTADAICPVGCLPGLSNEQAAMINEAGHIPFMTAKEQFYEHLRGFLNELK